MKNKSDTAHTIQALLHKYYEAETSPEEESLLESFFIDSRSEEMPESMAEDRRLFTSMAELHAGSEQLKVPDALVEGISAITGLQDGLSFDKTRKRRKRTFLYAAAAACVCLMLALGIRWQTATPPPTPLIADQAVTPATEQITQQRQPHPAERKMEPEQSETTHSAPPQRLHRVVTDTPPAAASEEDDGFIEITDPEEAQKIIIEIGKLMAANTSTTNEGIRNLQKTVDDYKEISKSILQ